MIKVFSSIRYSKNSKSTTCKGTLYVDACEIAKEFFDECIETFKKADRPDLEAKFINALGEALQRLRYWDELENIAERSIELHLEDPMRLSHDYGLLADAKRFKSLELKNEAKESLQNKAKKYAEKALKTLDSIETWELTEFTSDRKKLLDSPRNYLREYLLLTLARPLSDLNQKAEAIQKLEMARDTGDPQYDPRLYIDILEELGKLYYEQSKYLEAFETKRKQQLIEKQYGFRSFIGVGCLQPQYSVINPALIPLQRQDENAQEIAASGRARAMIIVSAITLCDGSQERFRRRWRPFPRWPNRHRNVVQ